jgi:thiamine kinase-like enzyme
MIEVLKEYQLFREQKISSLKRLENQGHCNINYLLVTKQKKYLIRRFKLTNDRKSEFKIQKAIAKKNIGATPLLLDEFNAIMVSEFIDGTHKTKLNRISLKKLALLIRKLHKIKIRQKPTYLKKDFTPKEKKALQALRKLKTYKKEPVLCHNDLHPQNILFGKSIKLIDWEYAGVNDRYFDLASIIIEFRLSARDEALFLRSYFKRESKANSQKLIIFKIIYRELWRVWFEKLKRGEL